MLKINEIEYSKMPVTTNEAFLISITITEENAVWTDVHTNIWNALRNLTWSNIKRKIF